MSTWALILFFHVGILGNTDSNATSVVHGFQTEQLCESAGDKASRLTRGTKKDTRFVCVQTAGMQEGSHVSQ